MASKPRKRRSRTQHGVVENFQYLPLRFLEELQRAQSKISTRARLPLSIQFGAHTLAEKAAGGIVKIPSSFLEVHFRLGKEERSPRFA
jgi:hypothetical protein